MSEPLVVVSIQLPEPVDGADPIADALRENGHRGGRTTPYPSLEALTRAVRRGRSWRQRLRPRAGHLWTATVRVQGSPDVHLAERDLAVVDDLAGALGKRSRLMLLLPSPAVLVEAAWRREVWGGGATTLPEVVSAAATPLADGYGRLLTATAGASRRTLAALAPGAELPIAFDEPAWSISARGVEILRRFNAHAQDKKERKLMREFVVTMFGAASEPEPAVVGDQRALLLAALPDPLAELWRSVEAEVAGARS